MSDADFHKAVADSKRLVADLEQQHGKAQLAVTAIVDRRKPLALAATMGDEASRRALAKLAEEERSAETRSRDLGFAIDAARAQLAKDQSRAATADLDERRATYSTAATAAIEAARSMDEAARALAAAQSRLKQAHADLSATGVGNTAALNRLIYRAGMTRALVSHGFAAFTDLPRFGDPLGNQGFEALVSGVVGAALSTNRSEAA